MISFAGHGLSIEAAVSAGIFIALAIAIAIALWKWIRYRRAALWPAQSNYHGITVGLAKAYDNRSLALMLDQLQEQLKTLQTLDSKKVSDGIGAQQADETKDTTITGGAGKADEKADGKAGDDKSPDNSSRDSASPKLSERALDLLAEQVNLSYDIFNLRLMLERAISDRLMTDHKGEYESRVQAVVGFPISIDPPAFSAGCAAIVEVRLSAAKPLSVVALFPQEETRNFSTTTSSRVGLSGSAQASGVPLNAGFEQSRRIAALRRETDTVALERPSDKLTTIVFAWEFRPTSDCPSLAPGMRQMLAVISMEQPDHKAPSEDHVELTVETRSYWRRFDTATQTLSIWSGWRALLTNTPTEVDWREQEVKLRALLTQAIVKGLAPAKYNDIRWYQVGDQMAVVIVNGKNFFSGTRVIAGGKTLDKPENGLVIKSEQSLQITVPLAALTNEVVLNGRYGPSVDLRIDAHGLEPFHIESAELIPLASGQIYTELVLLSPTGENLDINDVKRLPSPLLEINGRFATATCEIFVWKETSKVCVRAHVAEELVKIGGGATFRLTFPFLGKAWSLLHQMNDIRSALSATRFVDGEWTWLRFSGGWFAWGGPWKVLLDTAYAAESKAPDLLELKVATAIADNFDQAFVIGDYGSALVKIPRAESKAPSLDAGAKALIAEAGSQTTVEIAGTHLNDVKQVRLEEKNLPFAKDADA